MNYSMFGCELCGKDLNPTGPDVARFVGGWTGNRVGAPTMTVVLAEETQRFAHQTCVKMKRMGVSVEQERMF